MKTIIVYTIFIACIAISGLSHTAQRDVVIVPDLGTYLYYISLWDADNQFPVFMSEGKFTKKFLMSYPNVKITKARAVNIGAINEVVIYKALYASWGPEKLTDITENITRDKLKERLAKLNRQPHGIVITNPADMEFPGGFALAAGHKQLLDFYVSKWQWNDSVMPAKASVTSQQKETIRKDIIAIIERWGYKYDKIGDDIDYITLALDIQPGTFIFNPAQEKDTAGFALDDAINRLSEEGFPRDEKGVASDFEDVYAYVGRLMEAEPGMALYQAMCSLFLPIERAFYFDWWPESWHRTSKEAALVLEKKIPVTVYHQSGAIKANIETWRSAMSKGNSKYDFIHVSAAGGYDNWRKGTVDDIPDTKPVVVCFAHSNGGRNPKNNDTILGRWLKNGAYIAYGSMTEPYAHAFSKPVDMAKSLADGDTFGKAFQRKETLPNTIRRPWKLIYIGDPMRRLQPPCRQTR